MVDKKIPVYETAPSTLTFFSDCVRYNRPCKMPTLAKNWPALEKWADKKGGKEYLTGLFNETGISVYTDALYDIEGVETRKFSFRTDKSKMMTYAAFLEKQAA